MQHAGRAVVFSGTTVAISLLALVALPVPFLRSIGIAGMLIPLVSVAVAVTLLPVVLATIGPRLDWPRVRREDRASRGWTAWARFVVRRRWTAALLSTAVLGALVLAASSIQLGNPQADSLAQSGPARAGLEQLEAAGIGTGPLSPFDSLVRAGDPDDVARALAARRGRPRRRRARGLAPRRHRAGHRHPGGRGQLARRPGDARRGSAPRPPACAPTSSPAARPPRAPTSSTRSTAASRSSSR